jgi:inhibitor of KinA
VTDAVISPLGDSAITVKLGDGISEALSELVVQRSEAIAAEAIAGVSDVVPSYGSLTVHYEPRTISFAAVRKRILSMKWEADTAGESVREAVHHTIPVRYDGEDLPDVARLTGIDVDEVVRIHSSGDYRVFVIGFVPGFAYLGPLDSRLVLPRRESPRKRVPAGSVAIAENQTGVYPSETPGGWHLIGRTDLKMFDVSRIRPSMLAVGDRVRFVAAD